VGLVVGATDIEALKNVRTTAPDIWILAPGVGAQGASLEEACMAGLTKEGSGLLIPVSRAISKAENPAAAAIELRDAINIVRQKKIKKSQECQSSEEEILPYQQEFIDFALTQQVLKFGSFKLKSGRISPYFFNAGLFSSGDSLLQLGRFYAEAIVRSGVEFDVLFGPAYKGIPLVTAVSMCLASEYGIKKDFAYNRKEPKDHGEGGQLVGTSMTGKRVLIVDDVITAGTAIREAMEFLEGAEAIPAGVCLALDRQEKTTEDSTRSAVQEVENQYQIPVVSVIGLNHLATFLKDGGHGDEISEAIRNYREVYGVS